MQVHITDFWNVTPCSLVEIRRFLYEPTAFVFTPKTKAVNSYKTLVKSTRLHGVTILVVAVVVTFAESEKYAMPTPFVLK
jgi:hypothetical protein